jgi:pyranose oxidase
MLTTPDVFIAGAGIVACTYVRMLVDAGLSVMMVDAGPQFGIRAGENHNNFAVYQEDENKFGHHVHALMHLVSQPPLLGASTRNALNPRQDPDKNLPGAVVAYAVGGMAIHWTCAIPRHHPTMERINFISPKEWDILYTEAERSLNLHSNVFSDSLRHQIIKKFLIDKGWDVKETPLAAERINANFVSFTGADTMLGELATPNDDSRLTILPEHSVRSLTHKSGKVKSALIRNLRTGEESVISAATFIIAAGWLHTPQLLWNSYIRPNALGRYISDHTFTACRVILKKEIIDLIGKEADATSQSSGNDPFPLPIPMNDPKPHLYIPLSEGRPWHSQIFRESFQFDPLPDNVDSRLVVDLKWFGMIDPVATNQIRFESDMRDKTKMPQATFHFELSKDDKNRLNSMMGDMQVIAHSLGNYLPGFEPRFVPLGASTHTMGTARMGEVDDGKSVADSYSKVWGFDNLYLGGNCLIPTATASNPTLTSVALAMRAAKFLLSSKGS